MRQYKPIEIDGIVTVECLNDASAGPHQLIEDYKTAQMMLGYALSAWSGTKQGPVVQDLQERLLVLTASKGITDQVVAAWHEKLSAKVGDQNAELDALRKQLAMAMGEKVAGKARPPHPFAARLYREYDLEKTDPYHVAQLLRHAGVRLWFHRGAYSLRRVTGQYWYTTDEESRVRWGPARFVTVTDRAIALRGAVRASIDILLDYAAPAGAGNRETRRALETERGPRTVRDLLTAAPPLNAVSAPFAYGGEKELLEHFGYLPIDTDHSLDEMHRQYGKPGSGVASPPLSFEAALAECIGLTAKHMTPAMYLGWVNGRWDLFEEHKGGCASCDWDSGTPYFMALHDSAQSVPVVFNIGLPIVEKSLWLLSALDWFQHEDCLGAWYQGDNVRDYSTLTAAVQSARVGATKRIIERGCTLDILDTGKVVFAPPANEMAGEHERVQFDDLDSALLAGLEFVKYVPRRAPDAVDIPQPQPSNP